MAKAWNKTVRSYSSSEAGAPWIWETRPGMLSTFGAGTVPPPALLTKMSMRP